MTIPLGYTDPWRRRSLTQNDVIRMAQLIRGEGPDVSDQRPTLALRDRMTKAGPSSAFGFRLSRGGQVSAFEAA